MNTEKYKTLAELLDLCRAKEDTAKDDTELLIACLIERAVLKIINS